jgi:cysteine desulfurase
MERMYNVAAGFTGADDTLPQRLLKDAAKTGPDKGLVNMLQQIPHLARLIKGCGALFHTDAVQAAGKLPLDFQTSGAHLMSLSAHKFGGPKGVGALIADKSVALEPLVHGGGQERGLMCGTENVAAIVGFGRAAEQVQTRLQTMREIGVLRDELENGLRTLPGVALFGAEAERLPNTVMFGVEGIEGETLLLLLDQAGYAVSSGSACGSARVDTSPVLRAMNIPKALARSSIRVSLGPENKRSDIDGFLRVLTNLTNARASQRAAI